MLVQRRDRLPLLPRCARGASVCREAADQRRGAADRSKLCEAAGAVAERITRIQAPQQSSRSRWGQLGRFHTIGTMFFAGAFPGWRSPRHVLDRLYSHRNRFISGRLCVAAVATQLNGAVATSTRLPCALQLRARSLSAAVTDIRLTRNDSFLSHNKGILPHHRQRLGPGVGG